MKVATILPFKYLYLEASNDYHMFLAHLMDNPEYQAFTKWQSAKGAHTILDNGVVETGEPLPAHKLLEMAQASGITEMTLPDKINNRMVTLHLHKQALDMITQWKNISSESSQLMWRNQKVMLIPQGCDKEDWINSVGDMLALARRYPANVEAIGISKFCVGPKLFTSRLEALTSVPKLLQSDLDIHLLGCPNRPEEIHAIDTIFPERIRGIDSGLPVFYTQMTRVLTTSSNRPNGIELDFNQIFTASEVKLLKQNIKEWKRIIHDKIITQWRCEG